MNIIIVDGVEAALLAEETLLRACAPEAEVAAFLSARVALEYVQEHPTDVAFLDTETSGLNGLTLAREMKELRARLNIIDISF